MASFSATSSSAMACASFHAAAARSTRFTSFSFSRMRPIAQERFTAVGRVARSSLEAFEIDASEGSFDTASAMPNADATPIRGAPRTRIVVTASATASTVSSLSVSNT